MRPRPSTKSSTYIALGTLVFSIGVFVYAVAMGPKNYAPCTAVDYHDERYQYAVRAGGNCQSSIQRAIVTDALVQYVEQDTPDTVCGVQCLKLTRGGRWEGYVAFGAPTYDWEKYLDHCFSVSKLGQCKEGAKS